MSRRLTTQKRIDAVSILEFNHVLNAVIDLAEVPASAHDCFIQQIKLALAEAHRICEINREELATAKDAKALLEEIAANTNDLSMRLQKLDSSSGDLSNFDLARRYIEIAISAKFPESNFSPSAIIPIRIDERHRKHPFQIGPSCCGRDFPLSTRHKNKRWPAQGSDGLSGTLRGGHDHISCM